MGSISTTEPEATTWRERHELEALLRHHGPSFLRKVFHTVDPGATYLPNWHIDLMWAHLEALYRHELGAPGLIINICAQLGQQGQSQNAFLLSTSQGRFGLCH